MNWRWCLTLRFSVPEADHWNPDNVVPGATKDITIYLFALWYLVLHTRTFLSSVLLSVREVPSDPGTN